MQVRVAILANKELSEFAKKLAIDFSRLSKSYFFVDGKKLAHHITLFDILPGKNKVITVAKAGQAFVHKNLPIDLGIKSTWKSRNGYLGLKIQHTRKLLNFRKQFFKALKDYKPQKTGNKYNAHITLTRYRDFDFAYKNKIKIELKKSFRFNSVILAKVDKHGQVYKILKEFKFKS